jgi:hypothetical protein
MTAPTTEALTFPPTAAADGPCDAQSTAGQWQHVRAALDAAGIRHETTKTALVVSAGRFEISCAHTPTGKIEAWVWPTEHPYRHDTPARMVELATPTDLVELVGMWDDSREAAAGGVALHPGTPVQGV